MNALQCPICQTQNPADSRCCSRCLTPLPHLDETLIADPEAVLHPREKPKLKSVCAGRYEIVQELGGGGMGQVYKARDNKLHRYVALKFLIPRLSGDKDAKLRFIQEAQAASGLDHQNICTIYEIDETPDGQLYIAMAYYEGATLKKKIEQGPRNFTEALDTMIQISRGLSKAHGQGIVHRDIKPANVIETGDHVMKILDFGLAKLVSEAGLTTTAAVIGTPAYMSPEQASGESTDQRTDLWSLGVVFYELLTCHLPFSGDSGHSILYGIVNRPPIPPRDLRTDIPEEAERIILKCLQKKSEKRYSSADQLLEDLLKLKDSLEKEKEASAIRKTAEARRETERRLATVLSGEILNSTQVVKSLEPEEAALVMNRCFDLLASVIKKYGGRIDRMTGNSFMGAFGVPQAIEDAPKKAVNTAIELRNSLARFNQDEGLAIPLEIRLGINTGTVIVGARGLDQEYSVLGEAVDLASQLCELSEKNAVTVGPLTHRYTSNDFEYEAVKLVAPKGRAEPGAAYRLLSSRGKPYRAHPGAERMIYSDMVGRDRNLDKLMLHVLKAVNGEGSIVSVIGEAGIGKSRLVAELSRKDIMKKVTLLQGRALSFGANLSFHLVIDILREWARIEEEDAPSVSSQKLEKAIRNVFPEGASEVYPFIATLMGLKLSGAPEERIKGVAGDALEKLILKNFRDLIVKVSVLKPLVLILEDLHWADSTSLHLLESLFRLATSNGILFINVLRPDYDTSERILRTLRSRYPDHSTEICLEPLNEAECATLIGNLLNTEALPDHIRELIARRAEGNPFFIEEVARSFIDDGIVEIKDGRFRVTNRIDAVDIPESISDIIMARVDKLDEQTKSLLKTASVIGRNFFYKILAEVAKSIGEIENKLEYLKEAQLILEKTRMEEIEYLFKHALAQEAVYNSILTTKRKALHLDVARSIEHVFKDKLHEFYGLLALHFSLGEDLDKAEEYLIKAGEEALKSSASSEALHYYQEALRIYLEKHGKAVDRAKVAMLEKNIAIAFFNKGQFTEAVEYFDRVLSHLGEEIPRKPLAAVLKFIPGLASFLFRLYFPSLTKIKSPSPKTREIIGIYEKKSRVLATLDPKRMFIDSFFYLPRLIRSDLSQLDNGVGLFVISSGLFCYSGISLKISRKILERAKEKIDPEDKKALLYYRLSKLMHYLVAGDWGEIEAYDPELVNQGLKIGELWATTTYCLFYGWVKAVTGNYDDSQSIADKVLETSNTYEDDFSKSARLIIRTNQLWLFRKIEEAMIEVDAAISFFSNMNYRAYLSEMYAYKARINILLGERERADDCFRTSREIASEGHPAPMTFIKYLLGLCSQELNQLEKAHKSPDVKLFRRLLRRTSKTVKGMVKVAKKVIYECVEAYRLEGILYWIKGNPREAFRIWKKSIDIGQSLSLLPELARTYFEIARRLSESGGRQASWNGVQAEEYLRKAEQLFTQLNMEWDLDALNESKRG
jgi:serine/threonine protein kinase/tetratricopeptide (TPR) repeat protein